MDDIKDFKYKVYETDIHTIFNRVYKFLLENNLPLALHELERYHATIDVQFHVDNAIASLNRLIESKNENKDG